MTRHKGRQLLFRHYGNRGLNLSQPAFWTTRSVCVTTVGAAPTHSATLMDLVIMLPSFTLCAFQHFDQSAHPYDRVGRRDRWIAFGTIERTFRVSQRPDVWLRRRARARRSHQAER
jgi:hypothetical protein